MRCYNFLPNPFCILRNNLNKNSDSDISLMLKVHLYSIWPPSISWQNNFWTWAPTIRYKYTFSTINQQRGFRSWNHFHCLKSIWWCYQDGCHTLKWSIATKQITLYVSIVVTFYQMKAFKTCIIIMYKKHWTWIIFHHTSITKAHLKDTITQ